MIQRIAPALCLSLFGFSSLALADEAAPTADPLVKVTSMALPHPDVPEEVVVGVMRSLDSGLKENKQLEFKDLDTRLTEISADTPTEELEAARGAFTAGKAALDGGNLQEAVTKLDTSVKGLARVLPHIKKSELADAMAFLSVAEAENGDKAAARRQFVRLLTWRSDYDYDVTALPPKYMSLFEEARKEVDHLKHGVLKIGSTPDGAAAYVDGKYFGVTPCTAGDLVAGEHFVTLKKEGYRKAVQSAVVNPKKEQTVAVELGRNEKSLLIEQAVAGVNKTIGPDTAPPEMDVIRDVLYVEQVVFVRVSPRSATDVAVKAWLYDLRAKRKLSDVEMVVARKDLEPQLATLAKQVYINVKNMTGGLDAPVEKDPPKQYVRPPVYKTWWFWTAAGVVLLAGVGTAIVVSKTGSPSCADGSLCPALTF